MEKKYTWSQTFEIITILIPLDEGVTTSAVKCNFNPKNICITVGEGVVCEGELHDTIYPSESMWYIGSTGKSKALYIELSKVHTVDGQGWWSRLLTSEDEPTTVESAPRLLSECSDETKNRWEKDMDEIIKESQ